jgi:hypothetical protein
MTRVSAVRRNLKGSAMVFQPRTIREPEVVSYVAPTCHDNREGQILTRPFDIGDDYGEDGKCDSAVDDLGIS